MSFSCTGSEKTNPDTSGKWRFYIKSIDFGDFLEVSVRYRLPAQGRGILNIHLRTCPQGG